MTTTDSSEASEERRPLDVRLLGPVRVMATDGSALDLGGPKPRMVLVRLALRAGEVVTTDSLIDTLWGDDPPPTARRSLQAHVAKLRAALGGDDGPLSSSGPGYLLDISRETVDVLRVEDRIAAAHRLLSSDPHHASDLISMCREDWTGTPLADLAGYDTLVADRERLARLGDELDDMGVEIDVARGDPASAVLRLERAVADQPTHEPHWVRLITAYYASGRQQDALEAYQRASNTLLDHLGVDPSPQLQRLEVQILRQEIDTADPEGVCPYKGLASYQIADGDVFYGRRNSTDELVNLATSASVGVVVGPSGVGKSSVLRAGLAHRVVSGQVPGIRSVAVIAPGPQPLRSLYEAGRAVDLIVVDQFEELFTLTDDEDRRTEFVDEVLKLAESGRTRVVLSLRADFYGHCLSLPALVPILGQHQVIIGAMSSIGLREAVRGPAQRAGLEIEPALLDVVVDEVADRPGALPLLSHALSETWRRRAGSTLTLDGYREAGSIAGAIAATAERLYGGTDTDGQRQLERLFRRLVEPGSGTHHTRRTVTRDELDGTDFDGDLIDRLVAARLLTASTDRIEIAHEALITAWPRLTDWIDGERDNIVLQQRLTRAAGAWLESDRDDADLYRGNKLSSALTWRSEASPVLSAREEEFLRVSDERAQAEILRRRRANRRLRILTGVSVVAMIAASVASFVAVGRSRDADRRREQAEAIQLATLVAGDESFTPSDRLRVAAALQARTPTVEITGLLFESLLAAPELIAQSNLDFIAMTGSAPASSTGMTILVADEDVRPRILDGATMELGRAITGFRPEFVLGDGERVLAVRDDSYEVVDLANGVPLGPAPTLSGEPNSAVLSSDAQVLALAYDASEGTGAARAHLDVVDVSTGSLITRIETDASLISDLELTSDGSRLIAIADNTALALWDVASTEQLLRTDVLPGYTAVVTTSAFNHRGDAIVIGRRDGAVEFWREADGVWAPLTLLDRHDGAVTWVEFDIDDSLVVSSGLDGSANVWSALDGSLLVGPVEFDASGKLASFFDAASGDVVTIDSQGHTWRWASGPGGSLVTTINAVSGAAPPADTAMWVAVDDGAIVSVSDTTLTALDLDEGALDVINGQSGDYVVIYGDRLDWRRPDGELVRSIPIARARVGGNPVAITTGSIAFWDDQAARIFLMDPEGVTFDEIELSANRSGTLARMDVSRPGRDLIYSTSGGELIWYSLDDFGAAVLLPAGHGYQGHFIDDRVAVAVGADGVKMIDFGPPEPLVTTLDFGRSGVAVAFDESRGLAATSDASGEVTLWDIDTGQQVGPTFDPLVAELPSWIGFDGGGRLVIGGATHTAVMSVDQQHWLDLACTTVQTVDPDGHLPADPRLAELEDCP